MLQRIVIDKARVIPETAYVYSVDFPKTKTTVLLDLIIDFRQNGTTAPTEVNVVDSIGKVTIENVDGIEMSFHKTWAIGLLMDFLNQLEHPLFTAPRKLVLPAGDNQIGYIAYRIPLGFGEKSGYPASKLGKLNIEFPAPHSTIKARAVTVVAYCTDEKPDYMLVNRIYSNTTVAVDDVQYQDLGYKGGKLVGVQLQEMAVARGGTNADWTIKEIQYCVDRVPKIRHQTNDILIQYTSTKEFLDHFGIVAGKGIEIGDYYSIGYVAGVANSAYVAYAWILKKV